MEFDAQKEAERIAKNMGITEFEHIRYLVTELNTIHTQGRLQVVNEFEELNTIGG